MGMACLVGASVLTSMAAFGFEVTERQARTSAALWALRFTKTTCVLRTITTDWTSGVYSLGAPRQIEFGLRLVF